MARVFPVKEQRYHACPDGCGLFLQQDEATQCKCGAARYRDAARTIPATTMAYLPLKDQLITILAYPETRDALCSLRERDYQEHMMVDLFDGQLFHGRQKNLFINEYDIALALYVDGFKPFKRTRISLTIVHLVVLNLPPEIRCVWDYVVLREKHMLIAINDVL